MGIHMFKYNDRVELSQMLTIVADNKVPEWTFSSLFGRQKRISACPLADESKVVIYSINNTADLSPQPTSYDEVNQVAVYDLLGDQKLQDIRVAKQSKGPGMYNRFVDHEFC